MASPEGLRFREQGIRTAHQTRDLGALIALFMVVSALLVWRSLGEEPSAEGPASQVRVRGAVPHPGWVSPVRVDLHSVLRAAGASVDGVSNGPVSPGWTVEFSEHGKVRLQPRADLLVFGLPLPLNQVDAEALEALPGIGASKAALILEDRARNGPFPSVDSLTRVSGIGPKTLEKLRPFLVVESAEVTERR